MGKKIKTCIIGDSSVGKTSLLLRIIQGSFKENIPSTIGADYKSQVKKINGEDVQIELWDTSGQDKYKSIAKSFFRNSDGVLIVFSLSDDKSLKGLQFWINQVKQVLDPSVPKILLGNKSDLKNQLSQQAKKLINRLISQQNFKFYKVSAKSGSNLKEAYNQLIQEAYKYMKNQAMVESVILPKNQKAQKKGCC